MAYVGGEQMEKGMHKKPSWGLGNSHWIFTGKKRKKVLPPSSRCVLLKVGGRKEEFAFLQVFKLKLQVFKLKMSWVALAEGRGVNRKGPPAPSGCLRSWNDL